MRTMMHEEIIFSGFGGQGVLFAGQLLAYCVLAEGRHVTWIPSYGPEMRGGTANCTVVVSEEPIGSPMSQHPSVAVVFNNPSLEKYEAPLKPDVLLRTDQDSPDQMVREIVRTLVSSTAQSDIAIRTPLVAKNTGTDPVNP